MSNEIISLLGQIWWQIALVVLIWLGLIIYFKKNPKILMKKIEKNAIKVDGTEPQVYLKKSKTTGEWRVIYPPIKIETIPTKEDGEFDWDADWSKVKYDKLKFLFGSKTTAITTLVVVVLVFLTIFGVSEIINSYNNVMSSPAIQACLSSRGINISG